VRIHTLVNASTLTHGGKKTAGRQRIDIPLEMHHYTAEELIERVRALYDAGYCVDVHVLAHRDRRKPNVQVWFPANVCPECRAYRMEYNHES
jgi:hypothetical protein